MQPYTAPGLLLGYRVILHSEPPRLGEECEDMEDIVEGHVRERLQ